MQSKDQMQTRLPITTPDTSFTDCLTIMNEGRMGGGISHGKPTT